MTSAPFTIRRALPADRDAIAAHNAAMALETEGLTLDPAKLTPGVEGLFARPEFGYYLVAEADGRVIGQTMITYEWSDWRNGPFFWIQSVYVLPAWRAKGVFRALHARVAQDAREAGAVGLRLYVERENVKAQAVYTALGWDLTHYQMWEKK